MRKAISKSRRLTDTRQGLPGVEGFVGQFENQDCGRPKFRGIALSLLCEWSAASVASQARRLPFLVGGVLANKQTRQIMSELNKMRVAMIAFDGFEEVELTEPLKALVGTRR